MHRKKEKTKSIIYIVIRCLTILLIGVSVFTLIVGTDDERTSRMIFVIINSVCLLLATFLPSLLEKTWKINIPSSMEIIFVGFCVAALLLGEILDFYVKFSWWDSVLHTLSGSLLACIGFIILNYFNGSDNYELKMNPFVCALFVVCFAVMLGVVWEIFEYVIDGLFGSNMQRFKDNHTGVPFEGRDALKDTMKDLALDMIGALAIAIIGFIDLKTKKRIVKKLQVEKLNIIKQEVIV